MFTISTDGGTPEQLLQDDSMSRAEPNWSPDGKRILFTEQATQNGTPLLKLLDLQTHRVTTVAGSVGYTSPRWSPDGKHIVAMTTDEHKLVLFDFESGTWSELVNMPVGFPNWSRDGQSVYSFRFPEHPAVFRIRISNHRLEQVADLKSFEPTGWWGIWLGLDPEDVPLMLRDAGTQDVYSLNWTATK